VNAPLSGGYPARRAVTRWAWRLFRREWRQQALVLALLGVGVAAAVGVASAAYNLAPAQGDAEFGSASGLLMANEVDPQEIDAIVAAAEEWFGSVDVIGYQEVPVPGLFDPVQVRAQDPAGPYGAPMLSLRDGRYPTGSDEVALTDGAARDLQLAVGDTLDVGGSPRSVVGLVENPNDLDDEFGLVAPLPGGAPGVDSVAILVGGSGERLESFRTPGDAALEIRTRESNEGVAAAAGVLVLAEVVLLLVSLVAAAGFVVVAQRRLRQVGMLAAIGATERHLRLTMVANGAVVGTVAASIGGIVGLVCWWLVAPGLETAARQRIDRFDVPWWLIGISMVLAVATATAAAWWPARVVARLPVTMALSGRPPRAKPTHASAAVAGGFIAAGLAALVVAGDVADDVAVHWANALLLSLGTLSTIIGVLLLSPLVIRLLAGVAGRAPIALRLALRDLARYQARSSVALAAISLGLGLPVAVVVSATAVQHGPAEGNLSERQLLVRGDQVDDAGVAFLAERTPAELEELAASVDEIAAGLDADATVTTLEVAFDPAVDPLPDGTREVVTVGRRAGESWIGVAPVYVASPGLLERLGLDPAGLEEGTALLTSEKGEIRYLGAADPPPGGPGRGIITDAVAFEPGYTSFPQAIITAEGLSRQGWAAAPSAWLVEADRPLTDDELVAARSQAVAAGVTLEARGGQGGLAQLRSGATAAGMLLALGVLAMTVGLMRAEAAGDLRTLTATGATSTVRRALTAATAGGLALGGVLLGTAGAYAGLIASFLDDVGTLTPVPILHLAAMVVGVPVVAAVAGWLLAGGEPPALSRQAIE
jgi:putative ABC transport system permease protein